MKKFIILLVLHLYSTPHAAAKIKIGFIAGFTGSDSNTAKELYRGVEVFLEEHPKATKYFEIIKGDNESNISKTIELLDQMKNQNIKIIVGIANSNEALAAAKYSEDNKMIFITPFATNVEITKNRNYSFRVCFTDEEQGEFLANYSSKKLNSKSVLILKNIDSKYSQGLAQYYRQFLAKNVVAYELDYTSDLNANVLTKIENELLKKSPDLIFIPDHIMKASAITKKIKSVIKNKTTILGGDGFGGQKIFMAVMGQETDVDLYYSTHWHPRIDNSRNKKFIKIYNNLYKGELPTVGAALTFDLMNMLFKFKYVMQDPFFSIELLAKKIKKDTYDTTSGVLKFKNDDNSPIKPIIMMSYKHGKYNFEK